MKLYSDFKFFRHKILSLILFSIFSVILDFVKGIESFTFADIVIGRSVRKDLPEDTILTWEMI